MVPLGSPPGLEFCVHGRTNSLGLNGPEVPEWDGQEPRVLVLGDSFVEARQVRQRDRFCARVETPLSSRLGTRVRAINAGVSSYSPLLAWLSYRTNLHRLGAKVVLFAFFVNDVYDDYRYSLIAETDQEGLPVAVPPGVSWLTFSEKSRPEDYVELMSEMGRDQARPTEWWSSRSYLGSTLGSVLAERRLRRAHPAPPVNEQFFILDPDPSLDPHKEKGWALTRRYLSLLRDECSQHGAELIVAYVPLAAEVYGTESHGRFFFSGTASDGARLRLRTIATDLLATYVDLHKPLQQAGQGLYFPRDEHWTPKGHQVVASALEDPIYNCLSK